MSTCREVETPESIADQTVGAALMNDGIGAEDFHHFRNNLQLRAIVIKYDLITSENAHYIVKDTEYSPVMELNKDLNNSEML